MWTANGQQVIYWSAPVNFGSGGVLKRTRADGSGQPESLLASGNEMIPTSVSPDGKTLLLANRTGVGTGELTDIFALSLEGPSADAKARVLIASPFGKRDAMFSPDGRWIAYTSNQSGRDEVYVTPYSGSERTTQISTAGGETPRWNPNGRELFYRNGGKLMVVRTEPGASFHGSAPTTLFDKPYLSGFDIAPDGKHFLMLRIAAQEAPAELRVVVNWLEELRQRAPAK